MLKKFWMAALVAITASLAVPQTSEAGFKLQLQSGSSLATIDLTTIGTNYGFTSVGTVGVGQNGYSYSSSYKEVLDGVTYVNFSNLRFAGYTITADTNITNSPGAQTGGSLDLTGLTIRRDLGVSSADDITLKLTSTDFLLPTPQKIFESHFTTSLAKASVSALAVITQKSYYNSDNSEFGTGTGVVVSSGDATSQVDVTTPLDSGSTSSYSLTMVVTATGLAKGSQNGLTSASASGTVLAPAPSALLLCLLGIPAFGLLRRRFGATAIA